MAAWNRDRALGLGLAATVGLLLTACAGLHEPARAAAEPGAVQTLDRFVANRCNPVVAEALAGAQVPMSNVKALTYGLYREERTGRIFMYDAFVSLNDQPGNIVVQVDDNCFLQQVYARGGAKLPS